MTPRRLHEFWITLSFEVEALDHEQAQLIAAALLASAKEGALPWKMLGSEVTQIEKVN